MNVGLDLRLVNTDTLEVVDVISYQKQIIGRQEQAGVFDFMGHTFFDASIGESALEPIQLAVRSVIERAVLEMISRLYHTPPEACTSVLGGRCRSARRSWRSSGCKPGGCRQTGRSAAAEYCRLIRPSNDERRESP